MSCFPMFLNEESANVCPCVCKTLYTGTHKLTQKYRFLVTNRSNDFIHTNTLSTCIDLQYRTKQNCAADFNLFSYIVLIHKHKWVVYCGSQCTCAVRKYFTFTSKRHTNCEFLKSVRFKLLHSTVVTCNAAQKYISLFFSHHPKKCVTNTYCVCMILWT